MDSMHHTLNAGLPQENAAATAIVWDLSLYMAAYIARTPLCDADARTRHPHHVTNTLPPVNGGCSDCGRLHP